jgi:hypothetical protein
MLRGQCRAARSRQRKAEAPRERDAEIRALLQAAPNKLRETPRWNDAPS